MSKPARVVFSLGLTCLVAVSFAAGWSGAETTPFGLASTLDGKTVQPHRIVWRGVPKLPAAQVAKVEFLIDGKVRWIERNPPYTYGDDSNWLVTSWLSPKRHTFTVRATANDGRKALRTTIARVVSAPSPPTDLIGTWKHSFVGGIWVLTVDKTGWKIRDPFGTGNFIDVAYFSGGRLQARGGIFTTPDSPFEGNGWCRDVNAPVDYRWAVSADTLTLTHFGPDRCTEGSEAEKQHYIWNGAWTKAG
jgi:hypothetical protein